MQANNKLYSNLCTPVKEKKNTEDSWVEMPADSF